MDYHILTTDNKKDEAFLRARTLPFVFEDTGMMRVGDVKITVKDLTVLVAKMKKVMLAANGIGLSANQIGLPYQLFIASVPTNQGETKFYTVLNPQIEKSGGENVTLEEGCLSLPDTYGDVSRAKQLILTGYDKLGRPLKIKAWGLLARVFQHEVDHLNGKLFIDRTKHVRHVPIE